MEGKITVRRAGERDAETIAQFNRAMARETEDKALDTATVEAGTRALLADPRHGFYLVAEKEGCVVGSLMITTEWSDWRNGVFWWIQSVYVRPENRRQGVYRALYAHVRALAQEEADVCGIRLYVEKENQPARRAYQALGMRETAYRLYETLLSG